MSDIEEPMNSEEKVEATTEDTPKPFHEDIEVTPKEEARTDEPEYEITQPETDSLTKVDSSQVDENAAQAVSDSEKGSKTIDSDTKEDDTTAKSEETNVQIPEKPVYSSQKSSTEPPPRSRFNPESLVAIDSLDDELQDELDSPKLLIQELKIETSEEKLKEYFSKFGEVRLVKIKKDSDNKSKGYGYVFFNDNSNIQKVLDASEHSVDESNITVKQVLPSDSEKMKTNKLFVGGLPSTLYEPDLRQYFEKFGKIEHFQFVVNKMTNVRKAFCFITFVDADAVDKITEGKIPPNSVVHTINGMTVDCKKKFDEDHPVQKKVKARSSYSNNRTNNPNYNTGYPQAPYNPAGGYYGYGYPTGYEQYYAQYGYGYPAYGYGYPGYGYPGYYPQAYGSGYGPMKQHQNRNNYKPY